MWKKQVNLPGWEKAKCEKREKDMKINVHKLVNPSSNYNKCGELKVSPKTVTKVKYLKFNWKILQTDSLGSVFSTVIVPTCWVPNSFSLDHLIFIYVIKKVYSQRPKSEHSDFRQRWNPNNQLFKMPCSVFGSFGSFYCSDFGQTKLDHFIYI